MLSHIVLRAGLDGMGLQSSYTRVEMHYSCWPTRAVNLHYMFRLIVNKFDAMEKVLR